MRFPVLVRSLLPMFVAVSCALIQIGSSVSIAADNSAITIAPVDHGFEIKAGDAPFCTIDCRTYEKPIVYPIYGPGQIPMTRNYPMAKGVDGEATDHPHHKSMWFGHGDVNGISFWHGEGKIVTDEAKLLKSESGEPVVRLENKLIGPNDNLVGRETMEFAFEASETARWIDWTITIHASESELVFGDTKEGTAAIRVHPNLRLDRREGAPANGQAVNSEGVSGGDIWGKSAKWVDYAGVIDGKNVGIAFFDHPTSFRYPTYWHARDYGLFAANPFGLSHFVGKDADGSHTVPQDGAVTFRYRIVFHAGNTEEANIESLYQQYVR
jgi:hypothetical protein